MDAETRRLIEQLQREDEEERRLQEERERRDEDLARKEQATEGEVWEFMQRQKMEQRAREQAQIASDEAAARRLAEQDAEEERVRQAQEFRETQTRREVDNEAQRRNTFAAERRERASHFSAAGQTPTFAVGRDGSFDSQTLPSLGSATSQYPPRRPSHPDVATHHNYPSVQSPSTPIHAVPSEYYIEPPSAGGFGGSSGFRNRPFATSRYDDSAQHARERLHDPHLRNMEGRAMTGRGSFVASRGRSSTSHPSSLVPSLQNVRSMDSLQNFSPAVPVSRPPYQGVPPRSAVTPGPGNDSRSLTLDALYRTSSSERGQDGRYPEPSHSAPTIPPLQLLSPSGGTLSGFMSFPSPQIATAMPWGEQRRRGSSGSPDLQGQAPRRGSLQSASPNLAGQSPPSNNRLRRPSTQYDQGNGASMSRQSGSSSSSGGYMSPTRPRSGSATADLREAGSNPRDARRSSVQSLDVEARVGSLLPYTAGYDGSLLRPGGSQLRDADAASVAGTISTISSNMSEMTVRGRRVSGSQEDDSGDTARAQDWAAQLNRMIEQGATGGTARLPGMTALHGPDDDEGEATLFLPAPTKSNTASQSQKIQASGSRPNLYVNTSTVEHGAGTITPSDSATESDSESAVPAGEDNQWYFRPDPEQLYQHLDQVFPKHDLDKPIVDGALSTPTTPGSESPLKTDTGLAPPPQHPSRSAQYMMTPTASQARDEHRPPPQHPARAAFNKAENRKSIRVMADHKRRTLQRENKDVVQPRDVQAIKVDAAKKPERRKSSSMWGRKLVEVTPSKLKKGQVPTPVPESPEPPASAAGGEPKPQPQILSWIKGRKIGSGSYGSVYLALNVSTGDMIAVKQVEIPRNSRDQKDQKQVSMIEALRSEIALLKDLEHPNIVTYLGQPIGCAIRLVLTLCRIRKHA